MVTVAVSVSDVTSSSSERNSCIQQQLHTNDILLLKNTTLMRLPENSHNWQWAAEPRTRKKNKITGRVLGEYSWSGHTLCSWYGGLSSCSTTTTTENVFSPPPLVLSVVLRKQQLWITFLAHHMYQSSKEKKDKVVVVIVALDLKQAPWVVNVPQQILLLSYSGTHKKRKVRHFNQEKEEHVKPAEIKSSSAPMNKFRGRKINSSNLYWPSNNCFTFLPASPSWMVSNKPVSPVSCIYYALMWHYDFLMLKQQ